MKNMICHIVSIFDVVGAQWYQSSDLHSSLSSMLIKHTTIIAGIQAFPHCLIHVNVLPDAVSCHLHAYPVAYIHLEV